jgi:two-component sensor histidine kinase
VRALFCDREGNIWAGTSSAILHRYVNGAFVVHAAGKAEAEQMTWVVARDPALGMVIGTESGRLLHWTGDRFRPHPAFPKSFDAAPMSYLRSRSGEIFVGTSNGLHVRRGKGKQFIPLGMVSAMFESKDGVVWIGASKGLWQYCEEGLRPFGEGKFPHVGVRAIQPARGGGLWLGTNGAGLIRLKDVGGRTPEKCDPDYASYTREQGLGSNWVMSVAEDSAGLLWLTTPAGGLTLLRDGTLTLFTPADGLPDQVFFTAAQDGLGYLWCSSNRGITRFRIADLVARADGRIPRVPSTTFGMDDGLVSDECNGGYQGSVALASDGSLWFPTASGAAVVDPRRAGRSADPPPVVIDRLAVDHEELPPGTPAEVGHGKGELEFHYVGLFLGGPERVAYRVRLVGFDPDWVDAGSRQTAYYTNIPPGEYTFRVEARVDDGAWGPAPAEANLTLSPRFTQTGLFALLCLLCIAGAVAGGFALYRRDRERELHSTRLESDLARTRLQVLEMQLQPHFLFNTLNSIMVLIGKDPEIARKTMGRLADILRRSLDRRGTQEVTLAEELEFLNRYVEIERVRFGDRLTVETTVGGGMEQALVPTMILQPLVENAIQHGVSAQRGPARITIAATRGENGNLVIDVEDNGLGLQPTGRAFLRKGIGLTNTQERLRQLYGESQDLRLQNLPGGGMSVRVAIPYHIQSVMA